MRTITLNNGVEIPVLGLGVYQVPPKQTETVVLQALEIGYRHVDTAACYGNEEAVGRALKRSGISRADLFVTTKLWVQDAGYNAAKRAFGRALDRLGLDYVDMYLIHEPFGDYYGAWRAMQKLLNSGYIRAIGVSNFHSGRLVDLIEHNDITPAVNQIETHVHYQRGDDFVVMRDRGVVHESWSPFAQGENSVFADPSLSAIGESHGKTCAQVVLRWLIQRGIVAIPKTVHIERLRENYNVFDFELSTEDMTRIAAMDTGTTAFVDHRDPEIVAAMSTYRFET